MHIYIYQFIYKYILMERDNEWGEVESWVLGGIEGMAADILCTLAACVLCCWISSKRLEMLYKS